MVGKSIIGNRKKSKTTNNANRTTLLSSLNDYNEESGSTGTISAQEKVSGIDWLREEILKYAMYDNKGEISLKMVKTARLVQKCWLQTTTRLLCKLKEPLVALTFDGKVSDAKLKEKQLDQLVQTFGASQRIDSFLPMKVHLKLDFFRERNYQSLSDRFARLGNDLVEAELEYPKSGGNMPVFFASFGLPVLRKLSFQFSDNKLEEDSDDDDDEHSYCCNNRNGLVLLQSILNASKKLKNLVLPFTQNVELVPFGFKYIQLPSTISFLDLGMQLQTKHLDLLLRNQLPNLSHLILRLHDEPFVDGILFKILEHFQKTLETFEVGGLMSCGELRPHTLLQFPFMEQLKKINVYCTECELGPGRVSDLQKILPDLTVVKLFYQTKVGLAKWTHSKFENVEELSVSIVNEQLADEDEDYYVIPSPTTMAQLLQTFPNIWLLSLTVNISDLCSLKSVFLDMVQLKTLKIFFFGDGAVLDNSSDLIDSTLLGLPLRLVVALKEDMELLETQTIIIKGGLQPSIRNLSELVTLTLETETIPNSDLDENGKSLISDILFRYAFKEMTTLRNLNLHKKFKPSLEMEEDWNGQGRLIKYYNV